MDKRQQELVDYVMHQVSIINPDWGDEKIQAHMICMRAVLERRGYSSMEVYFQIQNQCLENIKNITNGLKEDLDGEMPK